MVSLEVLGLSALIIIFAFLFGTLLEGIERKTFARLQNRIGPPILQPLYDILKLLSKETLVPHNAYRPLFLFAPYISLAAVSAAILLVPMGGLSAWSTTGDVIVLIYALVLGIVGLIVGASSSGSPFSAVGASREITLLISVELPLALSILSAAFLANSFSLPALYGHASLMLALGAIVFFLCMLAELTKAPFDMAEAETEIVEGLYTEYSGRPLAAFKAYTALKFFALANLFVVLFVPVPSGLEVLARVGLQLGVAVLLALLIALVRSVATRVKIHQASRFYLGIVLALAIIQLALVLFV
ncbi:MAG: NADH-quinone oxidoreductase subunit H [Candidatus Micrarchaeota archaeon]|nr:NADH-quinone oxidoreductase subunit H [Candidatus Micrarchaeota archaeon]